MKAGFNTKLLELTPKVIAWAEDKCSFILREGQPLDELLLTAARNVGVNQPEHIRVAKVSIIPEPDSPDLKQAAHDIGLLDSRTVGLTFGYGIIVCQGCWNTRLLCHEFRHVYQYEQAGSIAAFLTVYLQQIVAVGYNNAPFEIDARVYESLCLKSTI